MAVKQENIREDRPQILMESGQPQILASDDPPQVCDGRPQIYGLIGKAMREIGAIGKDSTNAQQGFKYRGIDAVYNALNPVMAKYGLFITPEIIDHKREERTSTKTFNNQTKVTTLLYSIVTIRYTVFAPDGSSVQMTVIGEGMDSGDKATNKAMSIAMKYAMFQLFMIPTEAVDPDGECHNVDPLDGGAQGGQGSRNGIQGQTGGNAAQNAQNGAGRATVTTGATLPQARPQGAGNALQGAGNRPQGGNMAQAAGNAPQATGAPAANQPQAPAGPHPEPLPNESAGLFLARRIKEMGNEFQAFDFMAARADLIKNGVVPDEPSATMPLDRARKLMDEVHRWHEERKAG